MRYNRNMVGIIDTLLILISAITALIFLGIVAGFSPTLYVTQVGISTRPNRARGLMVALMSGVLLGIILLSILFQFFQLDTLRTFIDSSASALAVSILFNIIIGIAFIVAGIWYLKRKPNRVTEIEKPVAKSNYWALVSLGFFRTFASISGATATFFASGIITNAKLGIITHIILIAVFLAATIAPFVVIVITMQRYPKRIKNILDWLKVRLLRYNYKLVLSASSILIGCAIVIFNLLSAISF